jgi:ADP-glucose pyrophosphorylase
LKRKGIPSFIGKNCEIYCDMKNSSLGNNVFAEEGSRLDSCVIYDNVYIGRNVQLYNCVIGENSKIGSFANLKNTVVGDNEIVEEKTVLDNKIVWNQPVPRGYPDKQIGNPIENK